MASGTPLPNYVIQYATLSSNDVKQENDLQVSRDKVTSPLPTSSTKPVTSKPVTKSASLTSSLTSNTVELSTSTTEKPTRNPHQVNSTEMNNTHVRNRLMESVIVTDYVKNIYFSIKTTTKYHGTRLPVLMLTWFQAVKDKVFIVTDGLPNNPYVDKMQKAGFNVIVTPCQPRATLGYCCKIGMGFADYYKAVQQHKDDKDSYQWFCYFDDDIYVNIPQLSKLLQQYDSNKPYYVGKWLSKIRHKPNVSVKNESLVKLKAMNMTMKLHKFRYATGASFCISQALMIEAKPYFKGQDKFYKNCLLVHYPDDMTIGFVIGILLG
ncbi:beta-1,3-N-acetylglucosaminyltransferase radical fringe-like, partial [Dysidea avara]|uniref:beta-1,3-N-acetylglucosaminyltransferase radical fringe-like n=1 Tax=Dysidea avara TaxID=196820 RepID=UPI00331850B9